MILLGALLLAPLFGDHAVLQRGKAIPVWGSARPGEKVKVTLGNQSVAAVADPTGGWIAYFPGLTAEVGPVDLTAEVGHERLVRHDIVFGEVWLIAGEARLDFPALSGPGSPLALATADSEPPATALQPVRSFRVSTSEGWSATAEKGGFAGAAQAFARDLAETLDCPVGLLDCSAQPGPLARWLSPMAAARGKTDDALEADLYLKRVDPVAPASLRGILWSSGNADAGLAEAYRPMLAELIASWRARWGQGPALPFYWLQLPAVGAGDSSERAALLRWQQTLALEVPATGQAITLDLGAPPGGAAACVHEAGRRLALLAKAQAYGIAEDASGPVFAGAEYMLGAIRVHFHWADNGLIAAGKPPQGFELAGPDGRFWPATGTLAGDTALVRTPRVPRPVAVRYGWRSIPEPNLFNGAGLPAAPFTTE